MNATLALAGDHGLLLPPHGCALHYSLAATIGPGTAVIISLVSGLEALVGLVIFGGHVPVLRTGDFSDQALASGFYVCPGVNPKVHL